MGALFVYLPGSDSNMTDETETVETDDQVVEETDSQEPEGAESPQEDPNANLKKALQAERKNGRELARKLKELEKQAETANLEPDEQKLAEARREATETAVKAANQKLLKAEVKAAAKGRLSDPADAFRFLDLDEFEVSDDGEIDAAEIEQAIDALLESKPYLSAGEQKRFQQTADQGAKGNKAPAQVTRDQLSNMTPGQINKARSEGRLNDLLGVKN